MPLPELFANVPNVGQQGPQQLCVLAQDITTTPPAGTVETWNVSAAAPSALQGSGQFRVAINNEVMIVSAPSAGGTAWQFTRGAEGSVVATHSNGSSVYHFVTSGAMQTLMQKPTGFFTPEQYGAKGDGVILQKATMAAGSNLLNVADTAATGGVFPGFASNDIGKVIIVSSVGTNYDNMVGTIQQINSTTQAQLSFTAVNASPDVSGIGMSVYGTDDTSAIQQASDAAANTNFGVLQFDNKVYVCSGALVRGTSRYCNSQITLPYGGYRGGIGRITWRGVCDSSGTPQMPFPTLAGTTLVSTLIGQDYHTYMQPPTNLQAVVQAATPTPAANTYYYTVTATTAKGETVGSSEVSITVNGSQQVVLTWNAVSGATQYNVYRSTTSGGETTGSTRISSTASLTLTDTGLTATANAAPTVNTASFGIPSFIGGPTQELTNSFNGWMFIMEDMTILCPRNPSITGINLERTSSQQRRRVTVATLEFGYPSPSYIAQAQCLPNKPWAASIIDPLTGNAQGATGANEYVVSWGFFVGHTPTEHNHSTSMRFHTTKIPLGIRNKFVHMARYDYVSSETNPYFISGWDPTAVVIQPPAAPIPTTAATGGTVLAGTYGVIVSYVNSAGGEVASVAGTITTTGTTSTITIPSPLAASTATGWYAYVTQAGGATYTRQQAAGSPTAIGTELTITAPPTATGAAPPNYNSTGEKAAIIAVPSAQGDPQANGVFISQLDLEDYSDTSVNWSWATIVNHVNDANNQLRGRINSTRWAWTNGVFASKSGIIKTGGSSVWTRSASEMPDNTILGRGTLDAPSNTTGVAITTANVWTALNVSNLNATFVVPNNGYVLIEVDVLLGMTGTTPYSFYLGCVDTSNNYIQYSGGLVVSNEAVSGARRYRYRRYIYGLNSGQLYTWRLAAMVGITGMTLTHYYGGSQVVGNAAAAYGGSIFEVRGMADDSFYD